MNSENFHEYLKNPSMLHQVSYQELKSLVLQYPFSPNLRYLLLLKSQMDHHKDHERNLSAASVYSIDRKKLWQLMKQFASLQETHENYSLTDEYLELKDLSFIEELREEPSQPELEDMPLLQHVKTNEDRADLSAHDLENMTDQELQNFFQEDEGLDFLEDIFEETDHNDTGHPAPNTDQDPKSAEQPTEIEQPDNADQPLPEAPEEPGGIPEQDEASNDLPGEMPGLDESPELNAGATEENGPPAFEDETIHITDQDQTAGPDLPDSPSTEQEAQQDREQGSGAPLNLEDVLDENPNDNAPPAAEEGFADEPDATGPQQQNIPFEINNDTQAPDPEQLSQQPMPIPKDTFNSWLQTLRPPKVSMHKIQVEKSAGPPDPDTAGDTQDDVKQIAQNSISEDRGIATETLAAVLAMQGHKDRAIAMYERLSLQYPEKSSFFAAKIKELKK